MDGSIDAAHIALIDDLMPGASVAIISVEDLIADRMGQYGSGSAREMLGQARHLFALHPNADLNYLDAGFERKRSEIMESPTSKKSDSWPGRRISHVKFARELARRRAELGEPELPRNSGKRRTAAKRALLKAIEKAGGRW